MNTVRQETVPLQIGDGTLLTQCSHRRYIMSGMNGTGPEGRGSMTGRGAGRCAAGTRNVIEIGNAEPTTSQNNCRGACMGRGRKGRGPNAGRGNRNRAGGR